MAVMTVQKLSIALDEDVAREAKDAAECEGVSLSAWINEAAREALAINDGLAAVAEYEAEYGAFTEEELARADAVLARAGIYPRR
jgi:hypothetical protein